MKAFSVENITEISIQETTFLCEIDVKEMDKPLEKKEVPEERSLTEDEKEVVSKETGWDESVVNSIGSMEEYGIYKEAGLVEKKVGEKYCLIRKDIDMEQTDPFGRTNKERMEQGLAPLEKSGRPYELHHIGQRQASPLAELTMTEHRGKGNDTILHIKTKESEIDREAFGCERASHWENRAKELMV